MKRASLLFGLLLLLTPFCARAEETGNWMIFKNRTERAYTEALNAYVMPLYAGEDLETPVFLSLKTGESGRTAFDVPADGQYEIYLTYQNTTQSALPTEMTVRLDGALPFYEMRRVKLRSLWVDDGVFPTDRYGNEIAATPRAADIAQTAPLCDSAGRTDEAFLFELTRGEHTLDFTVLDGAVKLSAVALRAKRAVPAYAGQAAAGDQLIVIEGERMRSRSESSIRGAGEYNAALSPYDTAKRKINFLDGASFDAAGDTVTYAFTAPRTGWYQLGFYYRQNVKTNFPVFVDVLIDGALPSLAAKEIAFDYRANFGLMKATYDGTAQTFYLEKGDHTLSLRVNCSCLTPVYEMIDDLLAEINGLSLEVVRLTGGVRTDQYRDYQLLTYIPNLVDLLNGWADQCDAMVERMKSLSTTGSGSAFSSLSLCAAQLRRLALEPEDLPRRLAELSTGTNSAARMLAQQLQDMAVNDLSIDQIYLYQQSAALPKKAGFLESAWMGARRFLTSFGAQDYAVGTGKEGHLQVWMARSRQYVELAQNLIDSTFTKQTGIAVDLSIMPDANKLVLANAAGTAPDAVLSLQYVVPSYLNIRGALYDLTRFEDFPEIAQRFSPGLFIPYILGDGVYAMPETVNFWVMFYRADILDALKIVPPATMDEVKLILPELQRRNMNFYYPTAGMVGLKVFPGTLPLILQSGGSIYEEYIGDTTLDSDASLRGFRELTELFTVYNMPTDVPSPGFYQQFRDGTLLIGIADLATYNLLLNAAPELDGLWDIAVFPGLTDENGNVSRWTTGGAETMAILQSTQRPEEAWALLKWWSSEETQSLFGSLLQSTYGSEYIWPTANTAAFASLPLKASHKAVVMKQMEWMTEAPWVLGTYMLERELSNAFVSVVVNGVDARRALDTAVKRINRETYRKLEEFGYYKDGATVKPFKTPDVSVLTDLIERYERAKEEGQTE